jgi:uncharacterized protein YycO
MITLQFSSESGIGSTLITWFEWSPYSHVDFVLPDGTLLGARLDGGVQIRPAGYANFTRTERLAVKAPNAVLDAAKSQIGKPYDTAAIVAFGIHQRSWTDEASWFCSELVAWAFQQGGKPLLRTSHLNRITPADLLLSPYLLEVS